MTMILLARHGQASFGRENYDELSDLGVQQARLLGQHYAHTQRRIGAVFSGSLVRQSESARHFLAAYQEGVGDSTTMVDPKQLDEHILPIFNEFNHQDVFNKSDPAFTDQAAIRAEIAKASNPNLRLAELFDQAMHRWHGGEHDEDYIESWPQFNARAQLALEQLIQRIEQLQLSQQDSTVLVFTSGGLIAAIAAQLLQHDSKIAYQLNKSLLNTGVTTITLPKRSPRLLALNEYSHLFSSGDSYLTWR